jgi:hypothetical protein
MPSIDIINPVSSVPDYDTSEAFADASGGRTQVADLAVATTISSSTAAGAARCWTPSQRRMQIKMLVGARGQAGRSCRAVANRTGVSAAVARTPIRTACDNVASITAELTVSAEGISPLRRSWNDR